MRRHIVGAYDFRPENTDITVACICSAKFMSIVEYNTHLEAVLAEAVEAAKGEAWDEGWTVGFVAGHDCVGAEVTASCTEAAMEEPNYANPYRADRGEA